MPQKLFFARLVKVDEAKREVSGVLVAEVADKVNEIFDYESSKPYFKAWNRQFAKATAFLPEGERSQGNVREMHQPKAVGKLIACSYDDDKKSIYVTAHIDDDGAWRKCAKGIYTGFSIGGDYVDTWEDEEDPKLTRYTAKPAEASIVDNPAVPLAEFELVRTDGSRAMCKFASVEKAVQYLAHDKDGTGHLPYTKEDGKPDHRLMGAAWAALHGGYRGNKYEGPGKAKAVARLKELYSQEGMDLPSEKAAAGDLKKDMYGVAQLASLLQQVQYLQQSAENERVWEKDDSTMPEELRSWLADGVELLEDMVSEEGAELTGKAGTGENDMSEKAAGSGDLEKAGARHSKATLESLHAIKEHHGKLHKAHKALMAHHEKAAEFHGTMADCSKAIGEHIAKLLEGTTNQLQGNENEDLKDEGKGKGGEDEVHPGSQKKASETGDLAKVVAQLAEVVKNLQDQPADRKVAARVITKVEDSAEAQDKAVKVTPVTTSVGDRDISDDSKKELYKSIYANPSVDAPLAGRKQAVA
jgi:hypothetical protein